MSTFSPISTEFILKLDSFRVKIIFYDSPFQTLVCSCPRDKLATIFFGTQDKLALIVVSEEYGFFGFTLELGMSVILRPYLVK